MRSTTRRQKPCGTAIGRVLAWATAFTLALPSAHAADTAEQISAPSAYEPGSTWQAVSAAPGLFASDYRSFVVSLGSYEWYKYAALGTGILALLPYDQKIVNGSYGFAIRHRLMDTKGQDHIVARFELFGARQNLRLPRSAAGVVWYLGDGLFSAGAALGFGAYGLLADESRATRLPAQIVESLLITGPTILALKMATGREAPSRATRPGGVWRGYPGLAKYAKNQARYYSFPSGHVATAMSTLTVLGENYAENVWIYPVGGAMVGMLMVSLMNVGSHWASDFPLSVLIGYTAGRTVALQSKLRAPELAAPAARREGRGADAAGKPARWQWLGLSPLCSDLGCGLASDWRR